MYNSYSIMLQLLNDRLPKNKIDIATSAQYHHEFLYVFMVKFEDRLL